MPYNAVDTSRLHFAIWNVDMRLDQILKLLDQLSAEEKAALLNLKMSDLMAEVKKDFESVQPGESVPPEQILERLRMRAAQLQSLE